MTKEAIVSFLKTKKHTVISTISSAQAPESALIGFGQTDELEIIFGTSNTTRKYKNLKANNKVSFVIGWDEDFTTVQYQGEARELSQDEWDTYLPDYHEKVPEAAKFRTSQTQTYWLVKPTWVRYSALSGEKPEVSELTF
jgi:uncharacterized pyridoxamine 5'-phosphate oxidase family protein